MVVAGGLHVTIATRSDKILVQAIAGSELEVRRGQLRTSPDGRFVVESDGRVELRCPEGTNLSIGTTSGRIECRGALGDVRVTTSSGRVHIDRAASVDVRTSSGRVEIGTVEHTCTVRTTSSKVEVGRAGHLDVATTSGRVNATDVGEGSVQTVSGDVELSTQPAPRVAVRTQSASVKVTLPATSTPATNLRSQSGKVRCDCAVGDDGHVDIETSSGSITVSCQ